MREMSREEMKEIELSLQSYEATLMRLILPKDPNDDKNVMVEIRAGTGGGHTPTLLERLKAIFCQLLRSHQVRPIFGLEI